MELREAYDEARQLLHEHRLDDWGVRFDQAKRRAGICRFADRTIGLSAPLTRLHDAAEVRATILHEIAHALAGPGAGHGPRWQEVARRLGCSTERCLPPEAPRVPGAWVGVCSAGHSIERHRRPERVVTCPRCSSSFDVAHAFEWTFSGRPAEMHPNYVRELAALRAGRGLTLLGVGSRARVVAPGPYFGRVGTVVKRGRSRYHLAIPEGRLTVVFAGAEPA